MTIHNENTIINSNLSLRNFTINDRIIRLNYSENLFVNTFKYSNSLMSELKKKLDFFRSHDIKISKHDSTTRLYCMSCSHAAFERNSLIIKHILIEHCKIDSVYVNSCLSFIRFDPDFNLLPDKNMLTSVTQNRPMINNVISLADSDITDEVVANNSVGCDNIELSSKQTKREYKSISKSGHSPETTNTSGSKPRKLNLGKSSVNLENSNSSPMKINKNSNENPVDKTKKSRKPNKNDEVGKEKIHLKYSESVLKEYWNHLSSKELYDLKKKMNKFKQCSIRCSTTDSNRYFCNECDIIFDLCFDKIGKHIMLNHCGIHRSLIDDLMILASVDNDFQLISEKEMVKRINEKRRGNSLKPEVKKYQDKEIDFPPKQLTNVISSESNISGNQETPIETVATLLSTNSENVDNNANAKENATRHDANNSNTICSNESLINLAYSKVIFRQCFKRIDQKLFREIQHKMKKYERFAVRKFGTYSQYMCNECKSVTCLTIDKILKHIIIDHCGIPAAFVDDIVVLTSVNSDHQLISDKEMIERINEGRSKSEEKQNYLIAEFDENESDGDIGDDVNDIHQNDEVNIDSKSIIQSENSSKQNLSHKFIKKENIIQLNYSERMLRKCFQHIDYEEMVSLKEKLDNFKTFSMRKNGLKQIRFLCNYCYNTSSTNITKMTNHVLISHCNVPDQYIEELEIVTALGKDLQLIPDANMISKINTKRKKSNNVLPQLEDSENESSNLLKPDIEIIRTLPFDYSVEIFMKCFDHLSEKDSNDLQSKLEIVKRCTMTRISENNDKYYQCSECSFRHYTKAHNNFQPLRKHILMQHCEIPENLVEQCLLLVSNKPSASDLDENLIIASMNRIRLKEKNILTRTSSKDEKIRCHSSNNERQLSKKQSLSQNSNDDNVQSKCKIRKIDSTIVSNKKLNDVISEIILVNKSVDDKICNSIVLHNLCEYNNTNLIIDKENFEKLSINKNIIKEGNELELKNNYRNALSLNCNDNSLKSYSNKRKSSSDLNAEPVQSNKQCRIEIDTVLSDSVTCSEINEIIYPNHLLEQTKEVIEVTESKEQCSNTSNNPEEQMHKSIEENYEFNQDFYFNYSESLLKILCSVEMKLEYYDDIVFHLDSLLGVKHRVCKVTNNYIYKCSNCQFQVDCPYEFTKHVILNHTAIQNDLKPIAKNCVIVPIIDQL